MIRSGLLLIVVLLGVFTTPLAAQENKTRYIFPGSLVCEIIPAENAWTGKDMTAAMKVTGKIGALKTLKLSFFSSPDIQVSPAEATLEQLVSGKTETFAIKLTPGKPGSPVGTWIGITVEYSPDFAALEQVLSKKDLYPLEGARNEVLKQNAANRDRNFRPRDGTRFFFEAPKQGGSAK